MAKVYKKKERADISEMNLWEVVSRYLAIFTDR